jgi:general secretion pathway protein D
MTFMIDRGATRFARTASAALALSLLMSSCAEERRQVIGKPLQITKRGEDAESVPIAQPSEARVREKLTSSTGPAPPVGRQVASPINAQTPPSLKGEPVSINFEGIRLPAFINTVFGDILKVTFEIDSAVMQREQLVTLGMPEPLSRDQFYRLVTDVLGNYGISVVYSNNVYRIIEAANVKQAIPRIIRSRALGTIPSDMRPLFYFQPVHNIATGTMVIWLNLALKERVQAIPINYANGLLLLGNSEDVNAAIETIETLDQPYLAGSRSLKISPAFWSAQKLAQQLTDILTAEGYSIGIGGQAATAVKLIPVEALNIIVAFGTGQDALQQVLKWATDLDQPGQTVGTQGVFYHQVYNAKAKDIADTIRGISESKPASQQMGAPAQNAQGAPGAPAPPIGSQQIMVDEARNGLIVVGTAEEYARFRTLIAQMDRAPLEVMIEATVAEVTLRESENLGLLFNYDDGVARAANRTVVRSDDAGLFVSLLRDRGSFNARLNALADTNRVQILSSPRLVTSSGKSATINVGTQVPIITQQETAPNTTVGGTSSLLQAIQYRDTGVSLNVEPVINSNRRVELTIAQEVSDAQANNISTVQSPIILTRSLQTTLSLDDGETVLLGGLISENYSRGNSGVPYLKDIPVLGSLFKSQSRSVDRTELIVLLTPYIIDGPETARQVRDAFRSQLGEWAQGDEPTVAPQTPTQRPQ